MEFTFQSERHGGFAGTAESGEPKHDALLSEQGLFVLSAQHSVKDRIDVFIGFHDGCEVTAFSANKFMKFH